MLWTNIVSLALAIQSIAAITPKRQPNQPLGGGDRLLTFNETSPSAQLAPTSRTVDWISGSQDGQYVTTSDDGALVLQSIVGGASETFIAADRVPADYWAFWISPEQDRVLWAVNYTKQYRHSYFADYLIQDVESGATTPLAPDQAGDIQYAVFAHTGSAIAFVRGNNLFIHDDGEVTQTTFDGGQDLFNAVPDWVYEEEVFGGRSALWFSPDSKYIAFLSFNETGVGTFTIPYYMDDMDIAPSYPRELELRYPKVSTTNPTVQFNILDLASNDVRNIPITAFEPNNTIIGEVAWTTNDRSSVVYRAFNRVQDLDKHVLVNPVSGTSRIVRERDGTDGWLDHTLAIRFVGQVNGTAQTSNSTWYVDISDADGWSHLYLYPVQGGKPIQLTSGEWEVTAILKVDTARSLIYYTSTEHHSTERHVYSINYATKRKTALVDDRVPGYWSASFSSSANYYILSYQGPDVPYQEVYSVNSSSSPLSTLTSNDAFISNISSRALPNITYFELEHPEGFTLNVMQRLPPFFDPSKKYPVLFTPYGGPGAQEVSKRFQPLDWNAYIASDPELEYITYTIDNRGTGFKGRAFRSTVTSRLGLLEAQDQIWAAQTLLAQNDFLDAQHVGIWGWSFGGYLTAKVLETQYNSNSTAPFALGLITAPVSDWRFYDTMYTERYMKTLDLNADGYSTSAIRDASGFDAVRGGFAIMHGTGDDNVHYQHTAALVDLLVSEGVSPNQMESVAFTDSDHSIRYNGADEWIYRFLTKRLWEEKGRKEGGGEGHQWGRREVVVFGEEL